MLIYAQELEQKAGRIEELLTEKNKMQAAYNKLETQYKQMEADKNTIIKVKERYFLSNNCHFITFVFNLQEMHYFFINN